MTGRQPGQVNTAQPVVRLAATVVTVCDLALACLGLFATVQFPRVCQSSALAVCHV